MLGPMREGKVFQFFAESAKDRVMRDPAERHDRPQSRQGRDGRGKESTASGDLNGKRLVLRRNAPHGIGDRTRDQLQAIIDLGSINTFGEATMDQSLKEQIAGKITCKGPPSPISTTQTRREANHQEPRVGYSESGNRRIMPLRPLFSDGLTKRHETGAKTALPLRIRRKGTIYPIRPSGLPI